MALTISITADSSTADTTLRQLQANITSAMAGIDAKMQDTARKTGQATDQTAARLKGMSSAFRESQASIQSAIQANSAYAQSLASIATAAQNAQRAVSGSILGGKALGGAGAESVASLQAAARAGVAYQQSLVSINAAATQFARTQKTVTQEIRLFGVSVKELASGFGLIFGVQAAVNAVKAFGQSMIQAALDMDTARLSLAAVTGSTKAATAEMEVLRTISANTGVGIDVLTKQWAGLFAAVNQVPGRLEVTRDIFSSLIETSARMGKSTEQIGLALYGLTQIAGGTTLQMQDMNQVTDALPGILPALTRELGLTQGEFRKLIGEGKILVDDVFPKLGTAIRSLATGTGSVETLQSQFGRTRAAWTEFLDAIGQLGPIAALRGALIGLTTTLQGVAAVARDAKAAIFGLSEAQVVSHSLQNIQRRITETTKGIENIKHASTTGIGGLINNLMGLDQQKALVTKEQELRDLIAAQTALQQSQKALGPTAGLAALSAEEKAQAKRITDLKALDKTAAQTKEAIARLNLELSALRSQDPVELKILGIESEGERRTRETQILKARQDLQDQLFGIDRQGSARAAKEAETEAKRLARIEQEAMEQSLKAQEALIAQSFDERRQMIDARFAEDLAREPLRVKELAEVRSAELEATTVEEARFIEQVRIDSLSRQQLTAEQFAAQREAMIKRTGEVELKASQRTLEQQIKDAEDLVSLTEGVNAQIEARDAQMMEARTRVVERELDQQERAYEQFVDRVSGSLATIFEDLLSGTLNLLDTFKSLFLRTISQIAADVATRTIIVPIATQILGGLGAALPGVGQALGTGGLGGLAGTALQGAGIINTLMGPSSLFGGALNFFGDSLAGVADRIAGLFGRGVASPSLVASLPNGAASLPPGISAFSTIQTLGGLLAGITGLTKALTAKDTGGRVIGGLGAGLGLAGLVPGPQQPFLLAASAIVQLLGPMIAGMFSPAGPRFGLGGLGGVGIGTGPGGLDVRGDVTSRIGRAERIPGGVDTAAIQDSLNTTVMRMIEGMVTAINTAAVEPLDLLGPTQQALNDALANALRVNSSSAKNFQKDMEAQIKFVGVQVASFFLRPLSDAFRQLESAELSEQISRLPQTTQGMVTVFKGMNEQLDALSKVANTDVLRQLSSVRQRVEAFGHALADTAQTIATSIVDQISDQLIAQANVLLDAPLAKQITDFGKVMNQSFAALESLRVTRTSLQDAGLNAGGVSDQFTRLSTLMVETAGVVATDIVTGALSELSQRLDTVLIQPIAIQATTVNRLFNDSLGALNALWAQWHQLEGAGLDASGVQRQFDRLLGGMLDTVQRVTEQAFSEETFAGFLGVLLSIPDALSTLNPLTQQVRQLGMVFAQVAGPIQEVIDATQVDVQSPAERAAATAQRMMDLRDAIVQAGDAIDQALPLYAQLGQAIQANAQQQIEAVNAQAEAQTQAIHAAADAHLDAINAWAEAANEAIDVWAEGQLAELDTWVEASTDLVNGWADQMMTGLQAWVDASTQMVNDWAQSANTAASQLSTVNATLLGEMSPAEQRATLEAQRAQLEAVVRATGSPEALSELIRVNQALLGLAKESDNLALQQQALDRLKEIQAHLTRQLVELTGQSDPVLAQIVIAKAQENWLKYIAEVQRAQAEYIQTTQAAHLEAIALHQEARQTEIEMFVAAQREAIAQRQSEDIKALQASQEQQLAQVTSWQEETVRAIKVDMISQLQAIQGELQRMFAMQYQLLSGMRLVGAQTGGVVVGMASMNRALTGPMALAQGGMVHVLLEPRERVITPPMSHAQQGALTAMNEAFPRFARGGFTVPGSGAGDTVPSWVPSGSFVLNRRAAGILGAQTGGMVPRTSGPTDQSKHVSIHVDLKGSTFSKNITLEELKALLETLQRRGLQR